MHTGYLLAAQNYRALGINCKFKESVIQKLKSDYRMGGHIHILCRNKRQTLPFVNIN